MRREETARVALQFLLFAHQQLRTISRPTKRIVIEVVPRHSQRRRSGLGAAVCVCVCVCMCGVFAWWYGGPC